MLKRKEEKIEVKWIENDQYYVKLFGRCQSFTMHDNPKVYEKMMAFDIATQKYLSIIFTGITSINSMSNETEIKSFMSSQMNINITTLIPHTEMDRLSTLIYVPVQPNKNHDYGFEVKFIHFTSMTIKLIEGTTILYSAYMITHRQIKVDETYSKLNTTKKRSL